MEEELKKKDEKIATLLTKVENLRAARAEEIARLTERAEQLETLLVQADVLPVDATAREHEETKQANRLADQLMWKRELEKQRGKLQEDLYEGAKAEAKEELQAEGFYMPQLQPIPVGGRVVGFQRVAQHAPPENYFAARDKDRVGIRYRPGSVPAHMSVAHDGAPSYLTYVGDVYVPQAHHGRHYHGPTASTVVPAPLHGGSSFFRELAGIGTEPKHHHQPHFYNFNNDGTVGAY
jgi:hypothetical protein